jgi:predicted acylesterase/phospholipase RssA/CRP-like cAMP-binding protein
MGDHESVWCSEGFPDPSILARFGALAALGAKLKIDPPNEILRFLASTELFAGLGEDMIGQIANELRLLRVPAREIIIREGESGDTLLILFSGELQVLISRPDGTQVTVAELTPGSYVGEGALLTGDRRSASVVATTDAVLLELSRPAFERLIESHRNELAPVVDGITKRIWQLQLFSALHRSELFASLDSEVFQDLQAELEPLTLSSGQILFREGEEAEELFILISGRLRATHQDTRGERVLSELASGDTVGEMAVVGGATRTATVSAMRDSNVAKLSRAGFDRILRRHPTVAAPLFTRRLASLLREQTSERLTKKTVRTIAIVPANADFDFQQFCHELTEAFATYARVLHLSSEGIDSWLGKTSLSRAAPTDPYHSRLVEWLNSKETEYDHVLYQGDSSDTPWTQQCLRQADEILEVSGASSAPQDGLLEQALRGDTAGGTKCRVSLVLVYRDSQQPSNTARWLDSRQVSRHYHVRAGSTADFERLARSLTGRAIGLALGGGFARGIAHLGVIRALAEARLPIDAIGGTSMGAIIAGFHALGYSEGRVLELLCHGASAFRDWTLPIVSLHSGRKIERLLALFQGVQIEDLRLPYFCVATNLTRAKIEVIGRGPLLNALLATTRVPGIFPPIVSQGDLLVDGGLLNNVPADIMKDFCNGGPVIAVDVSPGVDLTKTVDYGLSLSGWRMLLDRLSRFRDQPRAPSFLGILARTVSLKSVADKQQIAESAALYLRLPLEQFRLNDFERGSEMTDIAYHFARNELEKFRTLPPRAS